MNDFFSDILYNIISYVTIEVIVLIIALSVLRKLAMLISSRGLIYFFTVVISSLLITFLLSLSGIHLGQDPRTNLLFFSIFIVLVLLNFTLLRVIFTIKLWKACLAGMLLGLINAFMVIASTPVYK